MGQDTVVGTLCAGGGRLTAGVSPINRDGTENAPALSLADMAALNAAAGHSATDGLKSGR